MQADPKEALERLEAWRDRPRQGDGSCASGDAIRTIISSYKEREEAAMALIPAVKEVESAKTNDAMCFAMDGLLIAARRVLAALQPHQEGE